MTSYARDGMLNDRDTVRGYFLNWAISDLRSPLRKTLTTEQLFACMPELEAFIAQSKLASEKKIAAEAEQRAKYEAQRTEDARPINQLRKTYSDYVFIKQCSERRQGYMSVYISDVEMDRAKRAAASIEQNLKQIDSSLDTAAVWQSVASEPIATEWLIREFCQSRLDTLERRLFQLIPGASTVRKDF